MEKMKREQERGEGSSSTSRRGGSGGDPSMAYAGGGYEGTDGYYPPQVRTRAGKRMMSRDPMTLCDLLLFIYYYYYYYYFTYLLPVALGSCDASVLTPP